MSFGNGDMRALLSRLAMSGGMRRTLCRLSKGCSTVFMLHRAAGVYEGINGHDPENLERILCDLKNKGFNLVTLQQVVDAAQGLKDLPSQSIAFTADDGYRDQLEVIAPIFSKLEIPLTLFLTTGLINGELWPWDSKINWIFQKTRQPKLEISIGHHSLSWPLNNTKERLYCRREMQAICGAMPGEKVDGFLQTLEKALDVPIPTNAPPEFAPATWDQVRQSERDGIRFAPHTHTHRILSKLTDAEVSSEFSKSARIIKNETQYGLPVLAYPVGMEQHFGVREMNIAEGLGFSAAFAVCEDYSRWGESKASTELRYCLGRFGLPHAASDAAWFATGLDACGGLIKNFTASKNPRKNGSINGQRPGRISRKAMLKQIMGKLSLNMGRFNHLKEVDFSRVERLVFVCRGNVCRSPYAESVAKSLGIPAISCGVDVSRSAPAETLAVRAALHRGYDLSGHMSTSIYDVAIKSTDCLVAMDTTHLSVSRRMVDELGCQVTLIGQWKEPQVAEIGDPYGKSLSVYCSCFVEIEKALTGLLQGFASSGHMSKFTEGYEHSDINQGSGD